MKLNFLIINITFENNNNNNNLSYVWNHHISLHKVKKSLTIRPLHLIHHTNYTTKSVHYHTFTELIHFTLLITKTSITTVKFYSFYSYIRVLYTISIIIIIFYPTKIYVILQNKNKLWQYIHIWQRILSIQAYILAKIMNICSICHCSFLMHECVCFCSLWV